jgi:tetratricopeptide (TPR) repeat protein
MVPHFYPCFSIRALAFILILGSCQLTAQTLDLVQTNGVVSIERYGEDIAGRLIEADNLMRKRDFERAIIQYDQAVAQNPSLADIYIRRAIAKQKLGRTSEARADIEHAYLLNPYAADLYGFGNNQRLLQIMAVEPGKNLLGLDANMWDYILTDYYDLDSEALRMKWNISPEVWDQWKGATRDLLTTGTLTQSGDQLLAILTMDPNIPARMVDQFLEQDPLIPFAIRAYLEARVLGQDSQTEKAIEVALEGLRSDPRFTPLQFLMAELYAQKGAYQEALATYQSIEEGDSELLAALGIMNRAFLLKVTGQQLRVLQVLDRLERLEIPNSWVPQLHYLRGNTHLLLGEYHTAREAYDRAIRAEPNFAEAYHNRALLHILSYNWPDACADFDSSIALGYTKSEEKKRYFCNF